MEFYKKLNKLRKEKGYSQEELSNKLNVSRQTISKWENGFSTPDSENLINIAKFFQVDVNELVNDIKISSQNNFEETKENHKNKKKIIIVVFIIAFVIGVFAFLINIIQRYLIIDNISKNFAYIYLQNNNSYVYSECISSIDTVTLEQLFSYENSYCKNDILKKEYYETNSNINLKKNDIELVRIEYRDSSNYFDINVTEKTYIKSPYDKGSDFYYNLTVSNLDSKICNEFNYMSSFKEKLLLALNFNYEISHLKGNNETDNFYLLKKVSEEGNEKITLTTSVYNSNYFLNLEIKEHNRDTSKIETISYNLFNDETLLEENINFINLSNYTKIN